MCHDSCFVDTDGQWFRGRIHRPQVSQFDGYFLQSCETGDAACMSSMVLELTGRFKRQELHPELSARQSNIYRSVAHAAVQRAPCIPTFPLDSFGAVRSLYSANKLYLTEQQTIQVSTTRPDKAYQSPINRAKRLEQNFDQVLMLSRGCRLTALAGRKMTHPGGANPHSGHDGLD